MMALNVLRGGKAKHLAEVYIIKTVRYVFLADVMFLFCKEQAGGQLLVNDLLIAGLILLIYFVGRIQSKQQRQSMFSIRGRTNIPGMGDVLNRFKPVFDVRLEALVVIVAMGVFFGFYAVPHLATNVISNWFLESILNIEDTPVFGFIFKVIGFFFLMSVILKITNALMTILTGGARNFQDDNQDEDDDDDHFDDYTEIK